MPAVSSRYQVLLWPTARFDDRQTKERPRQVRKHRAGPDHSGPNEVIQVAGEHATDQDLAAALTQIDRDHPGWHAWPGVLGGLVYARYPGTSPPVVVRAVTVDGLRQAIEDTERAWGLR
jgi:hypothetical protein